MAKDPFHQLAIIRKVSQSGRIIRDCYRLMYHRQLWEAVYLNLDKQKRAMPDQFDQDVQSIIDRLRKGNFRLSDSNQHQKLLVQEVIKCILENIFEPIFLKNTATFIRENSFHQALTAIKNNWSNNRWCIQIELKESMDLNPAFLISQIESKMKDNRFIRLVHHILHSDNRSILGPLCMQIHFHALDHFIFQQQQHVAHIQYLRWRHMLYIGTTGSKQAIRVIQMNLQKFFQTELNIDVSDERFPIKHLEKAISFGAYTFRKEKQFYSNLNIIKLEIPTRELKICARKYGYGNLDCFQMNSRKKLIYKSELEILNIYNKELIEIANYYRFAHNYLHLGKLFYLAEGSFIKTIAQKRKTTFKKVTIWFRNHKKSAIVKLKDL